MGKKLFGAQKRHTKVQSLGQRFHLFRSALLSYFLYCRRPSSSDTRCSAGSNNYVDPGYDTPSISLGEAFAEVQVKQRSFDKLQRARTGYQQTVDKQRHARRATTVW